MHRLRMMHRLSLGVTGVLLLVALLAIIAISPVNANRGRNEIDYLTIHELPLAPEATLTQPVELQNPDPYAIDLPYRWDGQHEARAHVVITESDGASLVDRTLSFKRTTSPDLLEPSGDGSVWQHLGAKFEAIRVPGSASAKITLRLTRLDHEAGLLVLFASDKMPAPQGGQPSFSIDSRPALAELPTEVLEFESEYGAPRPAWDKIPTYLSRLQSLAPPWLPFPMPELLILLMMAGGLALYGASLRQD